MVLSCIFHHVAYLDTSKTKASMMKRLFFTILFLASISLQAQTFEKVVFKHKTTRKTRTIKAGEHVKVKYLDNGKRTTTEGTLESVEDGVLYLFYQPGIPLDKVHKIRCGNPGISTGMFRIGLFLICVGFLATLLSGFSYATPFLVLGVPGMFLICVAFIIQVIRTDRIQDAGTAWEVETVMSALPDQSP